VLKSSEHYFFQLSSQRCLDFLKRWTNEPGRLQPEVLNKISEWFKVDEHGHGGLADWDISRDAPYFGIEIPDAPGKYFYVWLDAPVGYLASLKNYFDKGGAKANGEPRSFDEFLADPAVEQIHFIGKDITYFHTLFWPAMLKFSGRKVPDRVYVHGFITVSGEKMSKSRGTGISPLRYLDIGMNAEWLRYYIAAKLNGTSRTSSSTRRLRRPRQRRPGRQVRQHRQPGGELHQQEVRGALRFSGDTASLVAQARRDAATVADFYEARESARRCARSWRSPTASTASSTPRSRGCSPRIRRAAPSCRTSARGRCTGSRCSRSCSRRCCRRSLVASRASCSAATASSRGRTSTTCRRASRRTST
jgi:methionyl-tRNA synthetase